jgi:hypothetical protein
MTGRYVPISDTSFTLVRYRYTCCGADAIPLKALMMVDPSSTQKLPTKDLIGKWVTVTGRVRFLPRPTGGEAPALILEPKGNEPLVGTIIEILETDPNPYEY